MSPDMGQAPLHSACVFTDVPVGKKVSIWPNIRSLFRNIRKKPFWETKMQMRDNIALKELTEWTCKTEVRDLIDCLTSGVGTRSKSKAIPVTDRGGL
jgi:hypothetical protein